MKSGLDDGDAAPGDPGVPELTLGGVLPHAAISTATTARLPAADFSAPCGSHSRRELVTVRLSGPQIRLMSSEINYE